MCVCQKPDDFRNCFIFSREGGNNLHNNNKKKNNNNRIGDWRPMCQRNINGCFMSAFFELRESTILFGAREKMETQRRQRRRLLLLTILSTSFVCFLVAVWCDKKENATTLATRTDQPSVERLLGGVYQQNTVDASSSFSFLSTRRRLQEEGAVIAAAASAPAEGLEAALAAAAAAAAADAAREAAAAAAAAAPLPKPVDRNHGQLFARWTMTPTPFWISLHDEQSDPVAWPVMENGHYYEKVLTKCFYEILAQETNNNYAQDSIVIDVGGNIGWFTMVSLSAGHSVHVVEPNHLNLLRIKESILLNDWTFTEFQATMVNNQTVYTESKTHEGLNVPSLSLSSWSFSSSLSSSKPHATLYRLGAHYHEGMFSLVTYDGKPRQGALRPITPERTARGFDEIMGLRLDTLAEAGDWYSQEIAILKIDVAGQEGPVLKGAHELLASGIVLNVFVEIDTERPVQRKRLAPQLTFLVQHGYVLHKMGGSKGPTVSSPWPSDSLLADKILHFGKNNQDKHWILWWKLQQQDNAPPTT